MTCKNSNPSNPNNLDWLRQNTTHIANIDKGVSNTLTMVDYGGTTAILRQFHHGNICGIDRNFEILIHQELSRQGYAPAIIGVDPNTHMLLEYIPSQINLTDEEQAQAVAEAMHCLHTLSEPILSQLAHKNIHPETYSLVHRVSSYFTPQNTPHLAQSLAHNLAQSLAPLIVKGQRVVEAWMQQQQHSQSLIGLDNILCHCDLSKDNILFHNNKAMLIDFEYASYGHILFELQTLQALWSPEFLRRTVSAYNSISAHTVTYSQEDMTVAEIFSTMASIGWYINRPDLLSTQGTQGTHGTQGTQGTHGTGNHKCHVNTVVFGESHFVSLIGQLEHLLCLC